MGLVGLIGAATLVEHVAGFDLGIDTPLFFERTWQMAATAGEP